MYMVLLTTPSCIKCKSVKPEIETLCTKYQVQLNIVDATSSLGTQLINTHAVTQAPTLFIYDNSGEILKIYSGDIYIKLVENLLKDQLVHNN